MADRADRERGEELHVTPERQTPERQTPERGAAGGFAQATVPVFTFDRIRWGAIWAGVLVAIAAQIILGAFGLAIGLYGFGAAPAGNAGLWQALWAFIALFLGGFVASRLSGAADTSSAAWHGVVVWALAVTLGLVAGATGAAGIIGMIPSRAITEAGVPAALISNTAWGFFAGALIGLLCAIWGGMAGRRTDLGQPR